MSVAFSVDGRSCDALDGQTLLAALLAQGHRALRRNLVTGEARAGYCGSGMCFECEVEVDGRPGVRACTLPVRDGMDVRLDLGDA